MSTKKTYWIESRAGVVYGEYPGDTPEEAFAAMVEDAGGPAVDSDGNPVEGTLADWIIIEVPTATYYVIESWDAGLKRWTDTLVSRETEANRFATEGEAQAAISELKKLGEDWGRAQYRVEMREE